MADVFVPIPVATVKEAEEKPSLTYRLDLDKGRIVGKVDGMEAVRQAIKKAIITPRFKCLIYDNQYGCELQEATIAKDATEEFVKASAKGFVKDALLPDTRILSVHDFKIEIDGDSAQIYFRVDTIFGTTEIEEVI